MVDPLSEEIKAILTNGITIANLKRILIVWKLIPKELKTKLKKAVRNFFKTKQVSLDTASTNAELFTIDMSSSTLRRLKSILVNQEYIAILRIAEQIRWLNENNLHNDAEERRREVHKKYKDKGINIVDMVGTGDIGIIMSYLDKLTGDPAQQELTFNRLFDKFVINYRQFCFMIQTAMSDTHIQKGIIDRVAKGTPLVLVRFLSDKSTTDRIDKLLFKLVDNPILTSSSYKET